MNENNFSDLAGEIKLAKTHIARGDFKVAFILIQAIVDHFSNKKLENDLVLLSSQFYQATDDKINNLGESSQIINRVTRGLTALLDECEEWHLSQRKNEPVVNKLRGYQAGLHNALSRKIPPKLIDVYANCEDEHKGQINVQAQLNSFAQNDTPGYIMVIAGTGAGKTVQLQAFAYNQARLYQEGVSEASVLYIPIDYYEYEQSLEEYILKKIKTYYSPDFTWPDIEELLHNQKCVLILDGFDEVKDLINRELIIRTFQKFVTKLTPFVKCVVSCRSTFIDHEDDFFAEIAEQSPGFNYQIIRLAPLDKEAVRDHLATVVGETNAKHIFKHLSFLTNPLLLNIYTSISDTGKFGSELKTIKDKFDFIEMALKKLLSYKRDQNWSNITPERKRDFLEDCALDMIRRSSNSISKGELEKLVEPTGDYDLLNQEKVFSDLAVRTLFDADDDGLRFSHIIFQECLAGAAIAKMMLKPHLSQQWIRKQHVSQYLLEYIQQFVIKYSSSLVIPQKQVDVQVVARSGIDWKWISYGLNLSKNSNNGAYYLDYYPYGFWASETLLTERQYEMACLKVRGKSNFYNLSSLTGKPDMPIRFVTYEVAMTICKDLFAGTLPSEREFDRMARWIDGSYPKRANLAVLKPGTNASPPPVKSQNEPNPWGLYDVTGLLWQWTAKFKQEEPVIMGSYWQADEDNRLDSSIKLTPSERSHSRTGFRVIIHSE